MLQASAFGLSSVVYVPNLELETVTALSAFCAKASIVSSSDLSHTGDSIIHLVCVLLNQHYRYNVIGLLDCSDIVYWFGSSSTSCNSSFISLQQCWNCGIKTTSISEYLFHLVWLISFSLISLPDIIIFQFHAKQKKNSGVRTCNIH